MVVSPCVTEISGWIDSELSTYPFERRHVEAFVGLAESWVARQSARALYLTELQQNAPGCEINMEQEQSSQLG